MNNNKKPLTSRAFALAFMLSLTALGACSPRVENHGSQVHPEDIAAIQPGQTTRGDVRDMLGSPSSEGNFGVETWYYIFERTETTAFLAPEIKERRVLSIEFDEKGVVTKVNTLDESQGEVVEPAPGETPTAGNSLNFIQQMLSNLGRFNKK